MRDMWRTIDVKGRTRIMGEGTEQGEGEEESGWGGEQKRGRVGLGTYPKNYQVVQLKRY
jgi:hypothetical protein